MLKVSRVLEIGFLNQFENKFDRLLSECANNTLILGGPFKTAIVSVPMPADSPTGAAESNFMAHVGNIEAKILFEIPHACRFAHLFHQNLLFTEEHVYRLNQRGKPPTSVLKFDPPLTAVCRLSSKFVLTVDSDMMIKVYKYSPNSVPEPTYEIVAVQKITSLTEMITETTRDLLFVDKI
jgi:hypothetical protein